MDESKGYCLVRPYYKIVIKINGAIYCISVFGIYNHPHVAKEEGVAILFISKAKIKKHVQNEALFGP